jgi:hypothetical protein
MQRINFQKSDIRWVTAKEKSLGVFQLESVLRFWSGAAAESKQYALGAAVLAGNMYVDEGLCKDPPYMFQLAVGLSEHVIFRTGLSYRMGGTASQPESVQRIRDTFGANHQIFDSIDINMVMEPGLPLRDYADIAAHCSRRGYFTGLVTIDLPIAGRIEMEFPVKHLNLLPSRKQWQLESGPVLFLKQGESKPLSGNVLADLLPYFVHANRFDCAEFYPDFPFASGAAYRSAKAKKGKVRCRVQLLSGGN